MENKKLLIGKWQPVKDCDFINGHWDLNYRYEEGKDYYIFDEEHFTTHGAGYYEDGKVYHYYYDSTTQTILLSQGNMRIVLITATYLVLEISIFSNNDDGKIRIVLNRYPEE